MRLRVRVNRYIYTGSAQALHHDIFFRASVGQSERLLWVLGADSHPLRSLRVHQHHEVGQRWCVQPRNPRWPVHKPPVSGLQLGTRRSGKIISPLHLNLNQWSCKQGAKGNKTHWFALKANQWPLFPRKLPRHSHNLKECLCEYT